MKKVTADIAFVKEEEEDDVVADFARICEKPYR
jgi:hypothetical protein